MKSLHHNGVYIPKYEPVGLSIKYKMKEVQLTPLAEQLLIQFVKKKDTPYMADPVFVGNFLRDLMSELGLEGDVKLELFDFSSIEEYIRGVKEKTEAMSKEEKKQTRELRRRVTETLKQRYGFAVVDGVTVPLQSWAVEPPGILFCKGKNPLRGSWKRPVEVRDITLNMSDDAPSRASLLSEGFNVVWKPGELWIAKWPEAFDRTRYKYIWLSQTSLLRQEREKKKFALADTLGAHMESIEAHVLNNMTSQDVERRKLATVVYLIMRTGMRVGDEKIAGERGTVGCTTLKAENVQLNGNMLKLDFLGKDHVRWQRMLEVETQVAENLKLFIASANGDFIFSGIDSGKVAKFLREVIPGLSAKVFRTWLASQVFTKSIEELRPVIKKDDPEYLRKFWFKMANLAVAKQLNHKKAPPKSYAESLARKEAKLSELVREVLGVDEKKAKKLQDRISKLAAEIVLQRETSEWNLNTSLTSYIDPRKVVKSSAVLGISPERVYPKGLLAKYSWALAEDKKNDV